MKIVINGRFLAQRQTGVQRYALETTKALNEILEDEGGPLEFEIALPGDAPTLGLSRIKDVRVGSSKGHKWEQSSLYWHCRGAFLVNLSYSGPFLKSNQLVTIHDAMPVAMPNSYKAKYRILNRIACKVLGFRAAIVMTVSDFSKAEIKKLYGLNRDDIVVGREGASHAVCTMRSDSVLEKYGLTRGEYFLCVGSLKESKNFGLVERASSSLQHLGKKIAVVGGRDTSVCEDSALDDSKLLFLGSVPDDELYALYGSACCFIIPSLYEGFGLPAIEAMANDCPVVASNAASLPEVCSDAAIYFDPRDCASLVDALNLVTHSSSERDRLVTNGRKRLMHYSWAANARILLESIKRVLRF